MLTANENRGADSISDLARESYRGITLYSAAGGPCAIDLSDNTNLWGAPPAALRALATVGANETARYPVAFEPALRNALASHVGVSPEMIACGCGSDDVLDSAIRAFAEPGSLARHETNPGAEPSPKIGTGFGRTSSFHRVGEGMN